MDPQTAKFNHSYFLSYSSLYLSPSHLPYYTLLVAASSRWEGSYCRGLPLDISKVQDTERKKTHMTYGQHWLCKPGQKNIYICGQQETHFKAFKPMPSSKGEGGRQLFIMEVGRVGLGRYLCTQLYRVVHGCRSGGRTPHARLQGTHYPSIGPLPRPRNLHQLKLSRYLGRCSCKILALALKRLSWLLAVRCMYF